MEIIAHRGASFEAPENSLEAFEAAVAQGADRIEFDVQLTRDGAAVVFHDALTGRCGDRNIAIATSSLVEVRDVRLSNGEPIPTFDEVCDVAAGRVRLDVEIKSPSPTLVCGIVDSLRRSGAAADTLITTFHAPILAHLRAIRFEGRLGLLVGSKSLKPSQRAFEAWPLRVLERSGADTLVIHHKLAHRPLRAMVRKRGLGMFLWMSMEDEGRTPDVRRASYLRMTASRPDGIIVGRVAEVRDVVSSVANR